MNRIHVDVPVLETERLCLRAPRPEDYAGFRDYYASERSIYTGGPLGERDAWRGFAGQLGHWVIHGYGMWTITLRGDTVPLGFAGLWNPGTWPEAEIGWSLYEGAEGRGIAFEAARAALGHIFGPLGWETVVSYIHRDNARSITLAERLGATRDDSAARPAHAPDCLVYRHPRPGGAA
ncbi:GNAT family N-acetyltransferase [Tropicimonas sp. IMCC6043]|uniref:GNAT family N-acetyltransferase n=1 Tax=Tropicimonas sp. IMCC6043 TaxID=2510645 RepID=UPI00101E1156|nr:GNAT family N-acetyltransferase [Tropicimonas sp. IMCC6043]RYH09029.1 N-acetyltransferase [Tropicimonas sp. IMCC6043]